MKFETKLTKLGIDENEVKSIIENCECGEINGAYFIDLTKEKKEFIMEVIGNYLDNGSEEFEDWTDIKRISTFCKLFKISEDRIAEFYVKGFNEGGDDIAYELVSNRDVILVLTDDERYTNSFIQYSPSQQEETDEESLSVEELTAEYDAVIDELTRLDDETDVDEICTDALLMAEYETKKQSIEIKLDILSEKLEKAKEMEESEMEQEEKFVELNIEKDDDFEENFHATLKFTHNHESIAFDEDIFLEFAEDLQFDDNDTYIADKDNCSIYMEIPKTFSNYIEEDYEGENAEIISEWLETCRQYYARQLSRDAGIYAKYGEVIEQQVEDEIELDKDIMFEFKCAVSNDTVETFMVEHQYL